MTFRIVKGFELHFPIHDCHHTAFLQNVVALILWSCLSCMLLCLVTLLLINDELIA